MFFYPTMYSSAPYWLLFLLRCVQSNIVLLTQAFRRKFVIPDFMSFTSNIDKLYEKAKNLSGGQVRNSLYLSLLHTHTVHLDHVLLSPPPSAGCRLHSSAGQVQSWPVGRVSVYGGRPEVRRPKMIILKIHDAIPKPTTVSQSWGSAVELLFSRGAQQWAVRVARF